MRRLLPMCLLALLLLPTAAFAVREPNSTICVPGDVTIVVGPDLIVQHPNINGGGQVYAGTFNVLLDCVTPTLLYCVDISNHLCIPAQYFQSPDITSQQIIWILNNYYPTVPGMPSEVGTDPERAAAVQLALWHFSDGVDISSGGTPTAAFDAARAIILAAQAASVPVTPTTLVFSPPSYNPPPGTPLTITATLLDQNSVPVPNYPISWTLTNNIPSSGSGLTDVNGQYQVSWTEVNNDVLSFTVNYTVPIGLSWKRSGCQGLIQAASVPGVLADTWGGHLTTGARAASWGKLRTLYR